MTRVKICGITHLEDGLQAAQAGADALGFVFYGPSPRNVEVDRAASIIAALPPFVTSVGLFVDAEPEFIEQVIKATGLDLLQFHGDESESQCAQYGVPYIKALRMRPDVDLARQCHTFASSRGILLDAYVPGKAGGTGQTFDWSQIPQQLDFPIVLAGGLDPSNVQTAIQTVRPWAVDVSGGVEQAKGKKDPALVSAFIEGVHSVSP
ncbi:MAG: phosphoribosylanthranilate isomerase [Pseudomonadales bacterium]|nr:phosphoribosylanthranilate isomerase [Pseudomonadales bacterium]